MDFPKKVAFHRITKSKTTLEVKPCQIKQKGDDEPLEGKQTKMYLLEFILPSESKAYHQGTCSMIHLVKGL